MVRQACPELDEGLTTNGVGNSDFRKEGLGRKMKRSERRILTTHAGSLPRPEPLVQLMAAQSRGEPVDLDTVNSLVDEATLKFPHEGIIAPTLPNTLIRKETAFHISWLGQKRLKI